jgi:hypothetical protein
VLVALYVGVGLDVLVVLGLEHFHSTESFVLCFVV